MNIFSDWTLNALPITLRLKFTYIIWLEQYCFKMMAVMITIEHFLPQRIPNTGKHSYVWMFKKSYTYIYINHLSNHSMHLKKSYQTMLYLQVEICLVFQVVIIFNIIRQYFYFIPSHFFTLSNFFLSFCLFSAFLVHSKWILLSFSLASTFTGSSLSPFHTQIYTFFIYTHA